MPNTELRLDPIDESWIDMRVSKILKLIGIHMLVYHVLPNLTRGINICVKLRKAHITKFKISLLFFEHM